MRPIVEYEKVDENCWFCGSSRNVYHVENTINKDLKILCTACIHKLSKLHRKGIVVRDKYAKKKMRENRDRIEAYHEGVTGKPKPPRRKV